MKNQKLYEILIPIINNRGERFSAEHHKKWNNKALKIAGKFIIMKVIKEEWINLFGKEFYKNKMIPIRISCTKNQIEKIIQITIKHYNQEVILAYIISEKALLRYQKEI